jgi:hypothetical protein
MRLKITCFSLVLASVCFVVAIPSQAQDGATKGSKQTVSGSGCVKSGVEAGCIVVSDFETKKTYNLFFAAKRPSLDTAISFEGVVHEGPTTCMQGAPVDVGKWTQLKMKCPKEK